MGTDGGLVNAGGELEHLLPSELPGVIKHLSPVIESHNCNEQVSAWSCTAKPSHTAMEY